MSTAWRAGRDGRNPKRSGSRPAPRARSRGPAHNRVEYISAHGPNSQYPHYDDASSDSSSERYTTTSMRRRSIHIPRGSHMPRAPAAPGSPTSEPSLDSSSDSPSSHTSSRFGTLSPGSDVNPAIADDNWLPYTGAYFRGAHAHADQTWSSPPPATPALRKRRPVVPNPHPHAQPHPASPATDISSPGRRGGPKANSYLSADAPRAPPPPPEPIVIEVKNADPPPSGPSVIESLPAGLPVALPVYPAGVRPVRPPHHSRRRDVYHSDDEEDDADDDIHYRRSRAQSRPRYSVRHVEARPRSRSRHRRRPVEEEEERPRHRHRSRSRHHRHHHRSKSRPRPRSPPPQDPKIAAELRAEIDALQAKLSNIMDDPYAKDIIAQEGIKFDVLFKNPEEKTKS